MSESISGEGFHLNSDGSFVINGSISVATYGDPKDNSYESVKEFHETFGHPVADKPKLIDINRAQLRIDLIAEELDELKIAVANDDLLGVLDALGDLNYVVNGAALEWGVNLPIVTAEIHRSNMTKLGEDGKPIYREDGKILKGQNYEPPSLEKYL